MEGGEGMLYCSKLLYVGQFNECLRLLFNPIQQLSHWDTCRVSLLAAS